MLKRALQQNQKHLLPSDVAASLMCRRLIVATGVETVDPLSLGATFTLDTELPKPKFHAANRAPDACADQRVYFHKSTLRRFTMKRLALIAAAVLVAACSTKEAPKTDTAAPAMAPAPAASDTAAMKMDSAAMKMDTAAAKMDSAAKADSAKKP
ncbi:MAG TPA: hypothetical protein VJT85_03185 [Gemmatimonadaceae bacterium]|nr:hypothetical protein [Gemmatimonadaceae bacterium]